MKLKRPDGLKMIKEAQLERFPNRTPKHPYVIEFTCPEFTCICPRSGFPDFATIRIRYVPKKWCVELKSLKLYINRYRDQGIFHEDACNKIFSDLRSLLMPDELEVIADFTPRGNIRTRVRASEPLVPKLLRATPEQNLSSI